MKELSIKMIFSWLFRLSNVFYLPTISIDMKTDWFIYRDKHLSGKTDMQQKCQLIS